MNRKQKRIWMAISLSLFTACPLPVAAATDKSSGGEQTEAMEEYALDDIVVTATRTPVEGAKADANLTVVTAEQIARNHYRDVTDVMRDVPGVTVHQYALAGYNNSNGLYINGSDDVVILVDGVKQNYAGGKAASLASAMKDLDNIERIEVLRGSASTLYGSDAKGGVINIITKKVNRLNTKLQAVYGSYGRQQYSIANEGRMGDLDWRVMYQKDKSGDFSDAHGNTTPSKLDADSVDIHAGYDLSRASRLAFNFHVYKDTDKWQALYEYLRGDPISDGRYDTFNWNLVYDAKIDDTTKNQLVIARSKYFYSLREGTPKRYALDVWGWKISDQFDKKLGDHLLTAGFEFTKDETRSPASSVLINRSYYLQDQWRIAPEVKLTAGIRHDRNSGFGSHNSPSISIGYDIDRETHFYASYSEYFLTPSPSNLFHPTYGNRNMKPESGYTKEVGINHDFGHGLNLSVHYFQRQSKDRIGYNRRIGRYANVGDEGAHGWDVQLVKRFNKYVQTRVSYTRLNVTATDDREANRDGYLPVGQWNFGVDYENRGFDASLSARGYIDRPGAKKDPIGAFFPTSTYWVFDLALNYQMTQNVKVFFKINNLFNQFYAEHSNARVQWSGAAEQWWTAPGRNFMLGVEYSF